MPCDAGRAARCFCSRPPAASHPRRRRHTPAADRDDDERPLGALGNIEAGADGVAVFDFVDRHVRLIGPLSVIGRAVGVTAGADDGGRGGTPDSAVDGSAGPIVAAGVIGIAAVHVP